MTAAGWLVWLLAAVAVIRDARRCPSELLELADERDVLELLTEIARDRSGARLRCIDSMRRNPWKRPYRSLIKTREGRVLPNIMLIIGKLRARWRSGAFPPTAAPPLASQGPLAHIDAALGNASGAMHKNTPQFHGSSAAYLRSAGGPFFVPQPKEPRP